MYIDDITTGTEVTISVKAPKGALDFLTTTLFYASEDLYKAVRKISGCEHVLFFNPVKMNEKLVNFDGEGFVTDLSFADQGRIKKWPGIKIRTLRLKDKVFQFAASDLPGKEENRRGSFRLDLGIAVSAQLGSSRKPVEAMLENVSESGAGLTIDKSDIENIRKGESISIALNDGFLIQGFQKTAHFRLQGVVVRCEDLLNKFSVGCQFENANPISADGYKMAQYINGKQRERMKRGRK